MPHATPENEQGAEVPTRDRGPGGNTLSKGTGSKNKRQVSFFSSSLFRSSSQSHMLWMWVSNSKKHADSKLSDRPTVLQKPQAYHETIAIPPLDKRI